MSVSVWSIVWNAPVEMWWRVSGSTATTVQIVEDAVTPKHIRSGEAVQRIERLLR